MNMTRNQNRLFVPECRKITHAYFLKFTGTCKIRLQQKFTGTCKIRLYQKFKGTCKIRLRQEPVRSGFIKSLQEPVRSGFIRNFTGICKIRLHQKFTGTCKIRLYQNPSRAKTFISNIFLSRRNCQRTHRLLWTQVMSLPGSIKYSKFLPLLRVLQPTIKPWPVLRDLVIGPDPVTFVSNF
jgi:hypothetical protein